MASAFDRNKFPRSIEPLRDVSSAIENFIIPGCTPDGPLVEKTDLVFTRGSCFAHNLAARLQMRNQPTAVIQMMEMINSPLANRTLLKYAATGAPYATEEHALTYKKEKLDALRTYLPKAKLLVFTVGIAYCLFQEENFLSQVSPQAVRQGNITSRLTSVDENAAWLADITVFLRKLNPTLPIVFTLSPVPLSTSFGSESVFVADCLSKSTLRVALAQFMARNLPGTYYWPAFEIVRWLSGHSGPMYADTGDPRHVTDDAVELIVDAFLKYFVH